jgi:hypothetical protein
MSEAPNKFLGGKTARKLKARADHAKSLRDRIFVLEKRDRAERYEKHDAKELRKIIREMKEKLGIPYNEFAYHSAVHPNLVSDFLKSNAGKPRREHFRRMLKSAVELTLAKGISAEDVELPDIGQSRALWVAEWVSLNPRDVQSKISELSLCLDGIVLLIRGANKAPCDEILLTDIQRQQLIAVLETALAMLKSPMAELGLLKRLGNWLKKIAVTAAQDEIETALSTAASQGAGLVEQLFDTVI